MAEFETNDIKLVGRSKGVNGTQSKTMWHKASLPLSSFETGVKNALINYVDEKISGMKAMISGAGKSNTTQRQTCIGDVLYVPNREKLISKATVKGKTIRMYMVSKKDLATEKQKDDAEKSAKSGKPGKKPQQTNTAEKLKQANSIKTISELFDKIVSTLNSTELIVPKIYLNHDILEVRAIGFLYLAWYVTEYSQRYKGDGDVSFPFSVIVSLQRFIKFVTGYIGDDYVNTSKDIAFSPVLISDLRDALDKLIETYHFTGLVLYELAPKLIIESELDVHIPKKMINPYPHQKQVSDVFLNKANLVNGVLVKNRVQTNAGKTSSIVNIASVIKALRPSGINITLIATCPIQTVLTKMANFLYHSDIPFAIGTMRDNGTPKISYGYSCRGRAENCIAIICTPDVAVHLLKETNAAEKYALFHDELTYGSDNADSIDLRLNMEIISLAPKIAILCSATLSATDDDPFVKNFKTRFPSANVIDIHNNTIYGCSNVMTNDGKIVLPHLGSTTRSELIDALKRIEEKPFYGKFNNPSSLKRMIDVLNASPHAREIKAALPDVNAIFSDVDNLFADNIRRIALEILSVVATHVKSNDELVSLLCSTKIDTDIAIPFDYTTLGTTSSHKYPCMNLVATLNPEEFAITNFTGLLTDIKKRCKSFADLNADYDRKLDAWQSTYDSMTKRKETIDDELSRQLSELSDSKPTLNFPNVFQIGTREHVTKYAGDAVASTQKRFRVPNSVDCIDFDNMNASDDLQLLLCAGVGVYSTNTKLNDYYLDAVIELASSGRLEYLISDSTICYGTDYPIGGIFITKEFSDSYGLNTIYQLISRAGRGRNSLFADIHIDNSCAYRILSSIRGSEVADVEKKNMLEMFNKLTIV